MLFKVLPVDANVSKEDNDIVYLVEDNWNDFWDFRVLYQVYFKKPDGEVFYIGSLKIGEHNMETDQDKVNIEDDFYYIGDKFFSLGQDAFYYENLNRLGDQFRDDFLRNLNDIALKRDLFEEVKDFKVTTNALLRGIRGKTVTHKYHNFAKGNSALSEYNFNFTFKKYKENEEYTIPFRSVPDSTPPTNVQALIGRNGVGKTHLLNQMVSSLLESEDNDAEFISNLSLGREVLFDNVIYLSFSAFDETPFLRERSKGAGPKYSYIGLKYLENDTNQIGTKSTKQLREELIEGLWVCKSIPSKKARMELAIEMLYTDPVFAGSNVVDLLKTTELEKEYTDLADFEERKLTHNENMELKEEFREYGMKICKKFSSGHSIVLLTVVKLIETLEEKTLVLLDEPESHLHPPLLSTFTRILSNLLVSRNGIGIIATHSPVVLQEIPKKCVWIFNRFGREFEYNRPEIETFGENINVLTKEVFSFEITNAGYHNILKDVANKFDSYEEAISYFDNELGMEARAILRALIQHKEKK